MGGETDVVFGAGPLGLAVARALVTRGRRARLASRTGRAPTASGVEVLAADAADPSDARRVCKGAGVVYHCANAPYAQWPTMLPPLMAGIIEGAAAAGARLVYGDNLYLYGHVAGPLTEDLPARAAGPNGRTRARLAESLLAAHRAGRVRAAIGRASDFYGPHVRQSTVGDRVFAAALAGRTAQVLGDPDQPHTYTFIEDFAAALVILGERDEALGQAWHVPSAETVTTRQFVEMVYAEAGGAPRLVAAPRLGVAALALFNPLMRAVQEQLYQSEHPFVVDHGRFARAFGAAPTPHRQAIRRTLDWYRRDAAGAP